MGPNSKCTNCPFCTHMHTRLILIFLIHCGQGCLTKAAFMLILRRQNQRFETLIQNADPKRR